MSPSAAAFVAQPSLTIRRARLGRVTMNGSNARLKHRRRSVIGPRRDVLRPLTILDALEQTQAIVGIVDGRIVRWSRGAERLYGWTAHEAVGCRAGDLLKQNGAGASQASAPEPGYDGIWQGKLNRTHKDGRELSIAAQRVSGWDIIGRATLIELDRRIEPAEITDRPPESRPLASRPMAAKTEHIGADNCAIHRTAHDLKNLLGVISLSLELAREGAARGGELRRMIDEALAAAWQGSELTSRLADAARRQPA